MSNDAVRVGKKNINKCGSKPAFAFSGFFFFNFFFFFFFFNA